VPYPKLHYGVGLTDDAVEQLGHIANLLARDGGDGHQYFNCLTVDPNGTYLYMTVEVPKQEGIEWPDGAGLMEVQIPHHYVRYILSVKDEWGVGFLAEFAGKA